MGADLITNVIPVPTGIDITKEADRERWFTDLKAKVDELGVDTLVEADDYLTGGSITFDLEGEDLVEATREVHDAILSGLRLLLELDGQASRHVNWHKLDDRWLLVVGLTSWGDGCEELDVASVLDNIGIDW